MQDRIDTIAARRFLNALRGIGKTHGIVENVKTCIDDILLYKNEFEVLVVCLNVAEKKILRGVFGDYYKKYIDLCTMSDMLYKLSEFPINEGNPYDVPRLSNYQWAFKGKEYERIFVDPSCYEDLCLKQMEKLDKIREICL